MNNINWHSLPFKHSWVKDCDSVMSPGDKVTWPQLIMELIIENRVKYIRTHPQIKKGPQWSNDIPKQVRSLVQQSYCVCNYFPHPNNEPLVKTAILTIIKNNRVFKIGQYRKNRVDKSGKINITIDEMDFVKSIYRELSRLTERRDSFKSEEKTQIEVKQEPSFRQVGSSNAKKSIADLMKLETN